jgi:hypothetical protein
VQAQLENEAPAAHAPAHERAHGHEHDHGIMPPLLLAASIAPILGGLELLAEFGASLYERPWARTALILPALACLAAGGAIAWWSVHAGRGRWAGWIAQGVKGAMAFAAIVAGGVFVAGPRAQAALGALDVVLAAAGVMLVGSITLAAMGSKES